MLAQVHLIRTFEEEVLGLAGQKLINGPAHASIGQEAGAVGSVLPLVGADQVNGSHRGHHQFLAKAIGYVAPDGIDPRRPLTAEVREVLHKSMAEIAGLKDGYCYGRGGSMHLQWTDAGAMGTNAIVGGAVPFAAGFAFADKWAETDNVAVTYFGDGATNIGSVLETMNLAAAWKLPVCFFIENNQYAVSTTVQEATGEPRLSARGLGFGIPSWQVDGQDVVAVYLAMQQACEHMRNGGGPTVVEADTYRYFHQNGPFPGSAFGYRTEEAVRHAPTADVAVAVASEKGLVTPVIRDVASLSLSVLSAKIKDAVGRANEGRLSTADLQGGTLTVSNLGVFGVEEFDAIINPPQAGILAVGAAVRKPVVGEGDTVEIASVLSLVLSVDHRPVDGTDGARWLARCKELLEDPMQIVV